MKRYPSISVVTAAYNSERTLKRCLESIHNQDYPKDKVEIIVVDGGSEDDTCTIARHFGATVLPVDPQKQNAEYNKSIGIQHARNDIVAMIDHDNVLPHRSWFRNMIQPMIEHKDVVGVETLRYQYDAHASLLDRYFALFGAGDPLVWYMGKADRLSYIYETYNLSGHAVDHGKYYVVDFKPDNIPTIGANGFFVRRQILMDYAKAKPGEYFDMDVNVDLITHGFTTYAFIKDSILHLTGYGNVWNFLKRRLLFITQYRFGETGSESKKVRRYGELTKRDRWRLIWVVFVCSTLIIPLYDSIRGWRKIHDNAWFLHPFLCFSFVVIYSWVTIKYTLYGIINKFLDK